MEISFEMNKQQLEAIEKRAYEKGVRDMSDAFRKIYSSPENGGYSGYELNEIFPDRDEDSIFIPLAILRKYDPLEIIQKCHEYEENKNKLHVGDVIKKYDILSIVTCIPKVNPENHCYILYSDGSTDCTKYGPDLIKHKTGENMTIPEFLEKYGRIGE